MRRPGIPATSELQCHLPDGQVVEILSKVTPPIKAARVLRWHGVHVVAGRLNGETGWFSIHPKGEDNVVHPKGESKTGGGG